MKPQLKNECNLQKIVILQQVFSRRHDTLHDDILNNDTQHNSKKHDAHPLHPPMHRLILSIVMLSVIYDECRFFYCYAGCRYAECRGTVLKINPFLQFFQFFPLLRDFVTFFQEQMATCDQCYKHFTSVTYNCRQTSKPGCLHISMGAYDANDSAMA
jgi:hypothetical protein